MGFTRIYITDFGTFLGFFFTITKFYVLVLMSSIVWDKCFALSRENRKTFLPESPGPKTPRKLPFFFSLGSIMINHWLPSWKNKKKCRSMSIVEIRCFLLGKHNRDFHIGCSKNYVTFFGLGFEGRSSLFLGFLMSQ